MIVYNCLIAAKAKSGEAHARFVLLGPARGALLAGSVNRLFAILAEAELGEAFTGMVVSRVEAFAWPACILRALAVHISAARAEGVALGCGRQDWGRIAEAEDSKAHAGFVLLGPARGALLTRSVYRLFAILAEAELGKARASFVLCGIQATARPARIIAFAIGGFTSGTKFLAPAVRWQDGSSANNEGNKEEGTHGSGLRFAVYDLWIPFGRPPPQNLRW